MDLFINTDRLVCVCVHERLGVELKREPKTHLFSQLTNTAFLQFPRIRLAYRTEPKNKSK